MIIWFLYQLEYWYVFLTVWIQIWCVRSDDLIFLSQLVHWYVFLTVWVLIWCVRCDDLIFLYQLEHWHVFLTVWILIWCVRCDDLIFISTWTLVCLLNCVKSNMMSKVWWLDFLSQLENWYVFLTVCVLIWCVRCDDLIFYINLNTGVSS